MRRDIYSELKEWKQGKNRKPLILRGARQVGKTHSLKDFAENEYSDCIYINFEEEKQLHSLFEDSLNADKILESIALYTEKTIDPENTLIIFDEIQDCPNALNSLKYIAESPHHYHIVAAGSLLGVTLGQKGGYPVGKVTTLDLYPLSFFEFLSALGKDMLREDLEQIQTDKDKLPELLHNTAMGYLSTYLIVGGMPEVVKEYASSQNLQRVREIQNDLLRGYRSDFAKYASPTDAVKIALIWDSIPRQLAKENKKFSYKEVKNTARAREYKAAIKWLSDAGLVHILENTETAMLPLSAYRNQDIFKLYFFDLGLLSALSGIDPKLVLDEEELLRFYKGAITENLVVQELITAKKSGLAYWSSQGTAEVDILCEFQNHLFPLEIKSGKRIKSKSMSVYSKKYNPSIISKASKNNLEIREKHINYPLYLISKFPEISLSFDPIK